MRLASIILRRMTRRRQLLEHEGATAQWDITGEFAAVDNRTRRESYKDLGMTITHDGYVARCRDCGPISAHARHHDAVMARRDHYFDVHAAERAAA